MAVACGWTSSTSAATHTHWETDCALVKELGISFLRYGPPLYRTFLGPGR
jgi:beta-glucosidase